MTFDNKDKNLDSQESVIKSYAKTNVYLKLLDKRKDGYYNILTRMILLSLHDEIKFSKTSKETFLESDSTDIPLDENNLIIKAVKAFEKAAKIKTQYKIFLKKNIPHGAGLGGGSGNAAITLLALNKFYNNPINNKQIHKIAEKIGSDIPFFLYNQPAECTGRGEIVKTYDNFVWELPIVVFKFPFTISTRESYENWHKDIKISKVFTNPQICPWGMVYNDLELPVYKKYPMLAILKNWLLEQKETHAAILSGSGSSIITYLSDLHVGEDLAERAVNEFGDTLWTYIGSTLGADSLKKRPT